MYALWGKAWLDRVVAALVLVLGAPILALLALAVLLAQCYAEDLAGALGEVRWKRVDASSCCLFACPCHPMRH